MRKCKKCGAIYEGAEVFCPVDGARVVEIDDDGNEIITSSPTIPPVEAEEEDHYLGQVIQGRYKILSRLGEGGMGVVYIAEHVEIEKKVALKFLRDDFSKRPEVVARFRQEARSASKIGHPNIVDVTDFGQLDDGGVFFVMEYLQGCGLNDICRGEAVSLMRAVPIIEQIAKALKAAHDMEIIHRDMKPENVFLVSREDAHDIVKVLDFGIAKISDRDSEGKRLTKTGMIFGTPEYMSPEQAAGKPLDHRVDIYAVGCIMFELFTGQVPYDGDSFMAVLTQHMFEPIPAIEEINPNTDVPASVRAVVYKAMAKEMEERYEDMDALRHDLERALADANYVIDHPGREATSRYTRSDKSADKIDTVMDWAPRSGSFIKGKKRAGLFVALGIALGVLLLGGGVLYSSGLFKTPPPVVKVVNTPVIAKNANVTNETEIATKDISKEKADPLQPATTTIDVTISTTPKGGVISIKGMGQVCSQAPCDMLLEIGKSVEITATLDDRSQKITFTPSEQNKELQLVFEEAPSPITKRPTKIKKRPAVKKKPTKKKKPSSGLKIPDMFKDN